MTLLNAMQEEPQEDLLEANGALREISQFPDRILALVEVVLVAVGGTLLSVPITFFFAGPEWHPLASTSSLFKGLAVEAVLTLLLIFWLLALRGENLRDLGWARGRFDREGVIGLLSIPLLYVSVILVGIAFRSWLPAYVTETNPLLDLLKTPSDVVLLIISSIFIGGLKEEIQRAFILVRFEQFLGGIWVGLAIWTVAFGLGHQIQGVDNAVGATFLGLIFGLLFIWRRSLTAPIIAHAVFNVSMILFFWSLFR